MLFGEIQLGRKMNGYTIANHSATQLPQDLATAFDKISLPDVKYQPIWYLGAKNDNGTDHLLICKQIRNDNQKIVAIVVNVDADFNPSIVEVIDDPDLIEGVAIDANVQSHFKSAMQGLLGVQYSPILYLGSQIVKGINYFVIADARIIHNAAEPYPALITFNVFQDHAALIGIEPLH